LGLWNDHKIKKVSLRNCIWFWHANFTLKSSKENCHVAVGSQETQRVNPNEDTGILQKSHHPKDDSQDLTNQSSVLQAFEKKAAKGKGDEKSRNPRPTVQTSALPGHLRKSIDRISSRAMKKHKYQRMLGIKRVFVVRPAPSSTCTHPKFIFGAV